MKSQFDWDAPLIRQVAVDVDNGIASPLAAKLLRAYAEVVAAVQAGFYDVAVELAASPADPDSVVPEKSEIPTDTSISRTNRDAATDRTSDDR